MCCFISLVVARVLNPPPTTAVQRLLNTEGHTAKGLCVLADLRRYVSRSLLSVPHCDSGQCITFSMDAAQASPWVGTTQPQHDRRMTVIRVIDGPATTGVASDLSTKFKDRGPQDIKTVLEGVEQSIAQRLSGGEGEAVALAFHKEETAQRVALSNGHGVNYCIRRELTIQCP